MKTLYTNLALIFVLTIAKAQTIPNASFENWASSGICSDPVSWNSINDMCFTSCPCEQGTPGASGTSFLKLTVKYDSVYGMAPGFIQSTPTNHYSDPGFAVNSRPAFLNGVFQYATSANDQVLIMITLTKWNTVTHVNDVIGFGANQYSGMVSSWTNFSCPIDYLNGNTPDSAIIIFSVGIDTAILGDYLYIDNLTFTGGGISNINDMKSQIKLSIAPNPFYSQTILNFEEEQKNTSVRIIDILGKEIKSIHFSGKQLVIEKEAMKEGIYFIQITNEKQYRTSMKISVQ